jgi:hypothetical protein
MQERAVIGKPSVNSHRLRREEPREEGQLLEVEAWLLLQEGTSRVNIYPIFEESTENKFPVADRTADNFLLSFRLPLFRWREYCI